MPERNFPQHDYLLQNSLTANAGTDFGRLYDQLYERLKDAFVVPQQHEAPVTFGPGGSVEQGMNSVGAVVDGGSPVAARVANAALSHVGESNTLYYRDPNVACASFVSRTLQQALGANQFPFTSWAPDLPEMLRDRGWIQVLAPYTPISRWSVAQLQAGDVVMYSRSSGGFKHTEIFVGNGDTVGTSSSADRVLRKSLLTYPSWRYISAWRHP